MDFFNLLPDHLLHSILSLLPLVDAARMSILSRRWADHWAHIVDFDLNLNLLCPRKLQKQDEVINAVIASHHAICKIRNFVITTYLPTNPDTPAKYALDSVRKGVNEQSLMNFGRSYFAAESLLASESLTDLRLQDCNFITGDIPIVSCTNLRSLELQSVGISKKVLGKIVSTCRKLEYLSLVHCDNDEVEINSQSLAKLRLVTGICSRRGINVSAENLEELELDLDTVSHTVNLKVPKVRKCRVNIQRETTTYNELFAQALITKIVTEIGSSESLQLDGAMVQCLSLCIRSWESAISFKELKKLCLTLSTSNTQQTCAVNALLQNCPQLQEIRFNVQDLVSDQGYTDLKAFVNECAQDLEGVWYMVMED